MDREVFMAAMADALGAERSDLSETTELNDENWDSLAHVAAISAIDEKFGVTVPGKDLMGVRSVGELRELVERAVGARSEGAS